jgi:transcriptional regulator with XRE-family HTH domain
MGIKKELGKKIKNFRISKGYTQEKLSEMINISQKALSSIEIGENFVSAETFDKLVTALDTTAEELFATNEFKDTEELISLINENIAKISNSSEKLEIVYNLTNSLVRKNY